VAAFSTAEEAALVACLRAGASHDTDAVFNAVFDRLREPVFGLCRHLLGNRAEAEDAVQECFIAVHQSIGRFRGASTLSTWVYRIAIHAALRIKSRRPRDPIPGSEEADPPANAARPDDLAAAREDMRQLQRALEHLGEEHRTVLSLFAIDGLSHQEIAEVLGIPTGTVWSRLHAARKRLNDLGARLKTTGEAGD
jgi:RNA polymerase sigma-70 factor (ECF subfamily)